MKFSIQHIVFEITQECNLSCVYCYNYWRRNGYTAQPATFKNIQKTLKKAIETIDFQHITITGGEPLGVEGLEEIVLHCRIKGKGVSIITNGTVGKPAVYQTLLDLGVSLFEIPFHSANPSIHDSMTGCHGSFNKVLESIRFLKESKTEICLVCVLTRSNIDLFQQTLDTARDLGIKRFMMARYNIGGRGIETAKEIIPSLSGLRSAFRIANDFVRNNKMKISANVCVPFCIIDPKEYPNIPISSCGSNLTKRPVTIDSCGNMRICNHSPRIIGNIHSESVNAILTSEYANTWQTTCPKYCSKCNQWPKCLGGCRAASEQLGKSLENEDPIIEFMNESSEINKLELVRT